MKILVTGASGLVGHHVVQSALRRGHQVFAQYHSREPSVEQGVERICADLSQPEAFISKALEVFPDAIVNAAALSNPASVEADPVLGQKINVALPQRLAQLANHLSAQYVHISSDMVFDGQRGHYQTSDMPNPVGLYGEQKLAAEESVLECGGYHVTVLRIPIQTGDSAYGMRSHHEKLFQAWAEGRRTPLFTDEMRQPCSADNTAEVCVELCERQDLHGIFHWAGAQVISRYEMGRAVLAHFGLPGDLIEAVSLDDNPEFVGRPRDLSLEPHPLKGKLKTQPQTYAQQLDVCTVPKPFRSWYHNF